MHSTQYTMELYRDKVKDHMFLRHTEIIQLWRSFWVGYIFNKCY
jgi:hypothetical protein